jgi:hypothetical protein
MKKTAFFALMAFLVAGIVTIIILAVQQNMINASPLFESGGPAGGDVSSDASYTPTEDDYTINDNVEPPDTTGTEYNPPVNVDVGTGGTTSTGGAAGGALGGAAGAAGTGSTGGAAGGALGGAATGATGGGTTSGSSGSGAGSSGQFTVPTIEASIPSGYGPTDPQTFADSIVTLLSRIAGTLMIIVLFYGGILYISSAGNEEQVKKAQSAIKFAIIGIVVVLLAYYIVQFVVNLVY